MQLVWGKTVDWLDYMVNTKFVKCEEIILYIFTYIMYVTIAGKVNVISKSSFCKQETVLIDDAHLHVLHVIQKLCTKVIYSISLYDCVDIASIINTDRFSYYLFITIGKMCEERQIYLRTCRSKAYKSLCCICCYMPTLNKTYLFSA